MSHFHREGSSWVPTRSAEYQGGATEDDLLADIANTLRDLLQRGQRGPVTPALPHAGDGGCMWGSCPQSVQGGPTVQWSGLTYTFCSFYCLYRWACEVHAQRGRLAGPPRRELRS